MASPNELTVLGVLTLIFCICQFIAWFIFTVTFMEPSVAWEKSSKRYLTEMMPSVFVFIWIYYLFKFFIALMVKIKDNWY